MSRKCRGCGTRLERHESSDDQHEADCLALKLHTVKQELEIANKNGQHIHESFSAALREARADLMTLASLLGVESKDALTWKERLFERAKTLKATETAMTAAERAIGMGSYEEARSILKEALK